MSDMGYPPSGGPPPPPPPPGGGGLPPPPPPPGGGGYGGPPDGPPGGYGGPPGGYGGPPGGYGSPPGGGPPGGGPPGGFGGPPGGGPPGGFGGPPGGGPPGGFGGPPGGGPPGGFGGPPGGGPPGGYGPPPGGFGGPPGGPPFGQGYGPPPGGAFAQAPPPQKSGPNVGLLVGLGCGALVIIGGIIAGVAIFAGRSSTTTSSSGGSVSTSTTTPGTIAPPPITGGDLKAEVRDLRHFKGDFGKTRHFVGEIVNTGTDSVGFPTAKVTLFDAANTAVDSGTCASLVRVLEPGEKVPCTFSVFKGEAFNTFKVEMNPMRSFYRGELAKLEITDIKFTPKRGYNPHQLEGKITNKGAFKAKSVWALVSLYAVDGKIVGADQTVIAGNDLDPGSSALFTAKIYNVADKPETYRVKAIGYSD